MDPSRLARVFCPYYYLGFPPRATTIDHLYCFRRHSGHLFDYVNLAVRGVPSWLKKTPPDVVIFDLTLLSHRWNGRGAFAAIRQMLAPVKSWPSKKILLPQDEFIQGQLLVEFIEEFGVTEVFSVVPESNWGTIYKGLNLSKVRLHGSLTGYLEDRRLKSISKLLRRQGARERPLDIAYRAAGQIFWLGSFGLLKQRIAAEVQVRAPRHGLKVDIDTPKRYALRGNAWYKFLLSAKCTIGVEGGSSICDWDGAVKAKTESYLKSHPNAGFEEVRSACLLERDKEIRMAAISPRHLEACATKTCQILIEGSYSGILMPGEHYIPVKEDFSDLDEALSLAAQEPVRNRIVERAWRDIVGSGMFSYKIFAAQVFSAVGKEAHPADVRGAHWRLIRIFKRLPDDLSWAAVAVCVMTARCFLILAKSVLPPRIFGRLPFAHKIPG